MVFYKQNSNLKLKIIETLNGEKEYRRNCKFIDQKYHVIGTHCFEINNKYYRINSPLIIYDYELKKYVLKRNSNCIQGIIKNENNILTKGFFTKNPYNNVTLYDEVFKNIDAISKNILNEDWFEDLGSNVYYNKKQISNSSYKQMIVPSNKRNEVVNNYNIEDDDRLFNIRKELFNKNDIKILPSSKILSKYLGNTTFGIEYELSRGFIPKNIQNQYGIVPCRDGSLNGGLEGVTIPLEGAKGLQATVNVADEFQKRGEIDINCSLHIHFGNIQTDKAFVVALYRLSKNIQNEMFTIFPYFKTDPTGYKQKNYTRKLKSLNIFSLKKKNKENYEAYLFDSYNKMFNHYSEGKVNLEGFNKKTREHPIKEKYRRPSRYFWQNFMNMFFTHRHTVEQRLSTATLNKSKIINWLFISLAVIKYAEANIDVILTTNHEVSIKDILNIYKTKYPADKNAKYLSEFLYEYFLYRQKRCQEDLKKSDYASNWDITEDKTENFTYLGKNLLSL